MTFTEVLIVALGVSLALLVPFGMAAIWLVVMSFARHDASEAPVQTTDKRITVLIPSHHEGASLTDTIRCVLGQQGVSDVSVVVLINDETDSSVPHLKTAFAGATQGPEGLTFDNKGLEVWFTGVSPKKDKLNIALPRVEADVVAFLDADHRPEDQWLTRSVQLLETAGTAGVQVRRRPLAALGVAQIWDSIQNHIGNEMVNHAFRAAGLSVFFTGTGAVFRRDVLEGRSFGDCIAEDTFLTHDLFADGYRMAYLSEVSSYEEVAPGLRSFIARRRRWSAGHTHSTLSHFWRMMWAPIDGSMKLQFLLHGAFYLAPLGAVLSLLIAAVYLAIQLPTGALVLTIGLGALLGGVAARSMGSGGLRWALDASVFGLWVWPQLVFGMVLVYWASDHPLYFYLLTFPYPELFQPWQIGLLLAPMLVIVVGAVQLRVLHATQMGLLLLTWPLMLFFEIWAVMMGLLDLALGLSVWTPIQRSSKVDATALPAALQATLETADARRVAWGPLGGLLAVGVFGLVGVNEVLAVRNCGEVKPVFWQPFFFQSMTDGASSFLRMEIGPDPTRDDRKHVRLVLADGSKGASVEWAFGDDPMTEMDVAPVDGPLTADLPLDQPPGWETVPFRAWVEVPGTPHRCLREATIDTVVREVKGQQYYINGEPFLVKGLVPSYAVPPLSLSDDQGFDQISDIGANAVRVYHAPTASEQEASRAHQLLLMSQPNDSTWNNLTLSSSVQRGQLAQVRYPYLIEYTEESPYRLMDNLGNELELAMRDQVQAVGLVHDLFGMVDNAHVYRHPLTYSSYLTWTDYPADILGINMLDVGIVYWWGGLGLAMQRKKPVLATEFGGFVAFYERPPATLRMHRMAEQWDTLLNSGGIGAFFYQSHDNWAQPVPPGFHNDPLQPEQPDDLRGYWDRDNKPKLEQAMLQSLFADVEQPAMMARPRTTGGWNLILKNRRPYALEGISFAPETGEVVEWGTLQPGQSREVVLPPDAGVRGHRVPGRIRYTTHQGLGSDYVFEVRLPVAVGEPGLLDRDVVVVSSGPQQLLARVMGTEELHLAIPSGLRSLDVNGTPLNVTPGVATLRLPPSVQPVQRLELKGPAGDWAPFQDGVMRGGLHTLRFDIPAGTSRDALVVLGGIGASEMSLSVNGVANTVKTHNYRDALLTVNQLVAPGEGLWLDAAVTVEVTMDRNLVTYISQGAERPQVDIPIARPVLFRMPDVQVSWQR